MSDDENVVLGTGAREAVDGDLEKSLVPDDVDPDATGVKVAAKADTGAGADAASTSSAASKPAADAPAEQSGA